MEEANGGRWKSGTNVSHRLTYVAEGRFIWHMFRNRCEHIDAVLRGEQRPTKIGGIAY